MQHPLEFIPPPYRKRMFFAILALTLILLAVFQVLDQPLRTPEAPNGTVSFELAGTPQKAFQIVVSWGSSGSAGPGVTRIKADLFAAFGLGLDYLFMPAYALTLALGTLLAARRHGGWIKSVGALAGYGSLAAALFDAVENYALWQVLLGMYDAPYPAIAAFCAVIKFGLVLFGLLYGLAGWILLRERQSYVK